MSEQYHNEPLDQDPKSERPLMDREAKGEAMESLERWKEAAPEAHHRTAIITLGSLGYDVSLGEYSPNHTTGDIDIILEEVCVAPTFIEAASEALKKARE